jgi:hypothetical protein
MRSKSFRNWTAIAGTFLVAMLPISAAQAYGPLFIFDYEGGTPYRWDVSKPIPVYTDGGNFASGTISVYVPETCNAENGWVCYEQVYVEFTNEQGVKRVSEALASWSSVPTSNFRAEIAGSFADLQIGGDDADITGAPEEFFTDSEGNLVHEIVGANNGGGIHVVFDEEGSVMREVMGAPYGVLGIASPEWAEDGTGIITEGWVVIGGAGTYASDTDLTQMAGVVTHEVGHALNLAHTQTNGHAVMLYEPTGPSACTPDAFGEGQYRLPYPQSETPDASNISVMYPFINVNPSAWPSPTGEYVASVSTAEDFAAISSLYPADGFAEQTGTITGSIYYAFSNEGVMGANVVARNLDDPFEDAITGMSGDWNDGVPGAAQAPGQFILQGLTPGAQYAIHVENIVAGGFPTPQMILPGPAEYYNGAGESDDASADDACEVAPVVVGAGETVKNVDILMNGMQGTPQLVIIPAPNVNNITENGKTTAGTIINSYADFGVIETQSWIRKANDKKKSSQTTKDAYTVVPMGGIQLSDNGRAASGRTAIGAEVFASRYTPDGGVEILPHAGNSGCNQGGGVTEYYSNFAISPDGRSMGGFLWHCDNDPNVKNFEVSAVTYNDDDGWTVLNDHYDGLSSRVDAVSNNGVAVGWSELPNGWWEGRIWMQGEEISVKELAPAHLIDVGQATAVSSDGRWVVGINTWDEQFVRRSYSYDAEQGRFKIIDIAESCPWWDWFCFGDSPFFPYDIADTGTLVGAIGTASGAQAAIVADALGGDHKLADFLRGQGVMNASDLATVSTATKVSSNGRHIVGWTAVDGYFGSFKLTLDQLFVCSDGKSQRVGYPGAVADKLAAGATLGMCEQDLPLQFK